MNKKNVLVLANSSGGVYDFRNELMQALLAEYELYISVPDDVKTAELAAEGAHIIHTPINRHGVNPKEDLKLMFSYRKLMKQLKPALVLTYTIKPNTYGGMAAASLKIPYVETVTGLGTVFERKGMILAIVKILYKLGMRKAECIFFQNKQNMELFDTLGIKGKAAKLVNGSGVNLKVHRVEPYPKRTETHFLYVGRVMKDKGSLELIEAAKKLHSEQVHFDILGYCDEDFQQLLDEQEQQGVLKQLGFQTDVHPYLAAADAIVIPSYHEGMCNSLTEASATGRPVLASNISGCKEIIEDGETGFVFAPKSSDALVETLEKFLALPTEARAQMGLRGRAKMEREFDREQVTASYMDTIHQIIGNPV